MYIIYIHVDIYIFIILDLDNDIRMSEAARTAAGYKLILFLEYSLTNRTFPHGNSTIIPPQCALNLMNILLKYEVNITDVINMPDSDPQNFYPYNGERYLTMLLNIDPEVYTNIFMYIYIYMYI